MGNSSSRKLLRWLFVVAIVLAQARTLMGQESPSSQSQIRTAAPAALIEVASLTTVPEAPEMPAAASTSLRPVRATAIPAMAIVATDPLRAEHVQHRFWDRGNTMLFAAVGGMATADFFVTRANLAGGGKELNPVTRVFAGSTPALAANFALETGGVIGVSYLFHKTGHHKLERLTSFVNIGGSAYAVGYGLTHR